MQVSLLSSFASQFGNTGNGFTFFFRLQYFAEQSLRSIYIFMQIIIQFFLDEVTHEFGDSRPVGTYIFRS